MALICINLNMNPFPPNSIQGLQKFTQVCLRFIYKSSFIWNSLSVTDASPSSTTSLSDQGTKSRPTTASHVSVTITRAPVSTTAPWTRSPRTTTAAAEACVSTVSITPWAGTVIPVCQGSTVRWGRVSMWQMCALLVIVRQLE